MNDVPFSRPIRGAATRSSSSGLGCGIVLGIIGALVLIGVAGSALRYVNHLGEPTLYDAQALMEEAETLESGARKAAEAELVALKADTTLSPEELRHDPTLEKSLAKIAKIKAVVVRYHLEVDGQGKTLRAKAAALFAPHKREAGLRQFDANYASGAVQRDRLFQMDEDLVDDLEAAARFLKAHRGQWTIRGGQLLFYSPKTLAEFEVLAERIRRDRSAVQAASAALEAGHNDARQELGMPALPMQTRAPQELVVTAPRKR